MLIVPEPRGSARHENGKHNASYQDLLGPNYTGKVGMNDPAPPSD
jgi:hypothetical protein